MAKKKEEEVLDVADYLDKFAEWTEVNAKKIMAGFAVFTLAVAAFWGVSAVQEKALSTAAHETGVVNRKIDLLEKAISEATNKETSEFKTSKDAEITKIHAEALEVISEHSNKAVTDFTIIRWASFLVTEEKQTMALEVLEKAKPSGSRELSATGLFLKAAIVSKQGKLEDSIAAYDTILAESNWKLFHGEALVQKGALLQASGKVDEAITLFDQAKKMNKDSSVAKDAAKYKRLLQLKKNHPDIFKAG